MALFFKSILLEIGLICLCAILGLIDDFFISRDITYLVFLCFSIFQLIVCCIRFTPFGTAVIIDRKTHYCKTKPHGGFYFFNFMTDEITTYISTKPHTNNYYEVFETHDSYYIKACFSVTYRAENVENVLLHLKNDKRSINDIIKCAVDSTFSSFTLDYICNEKSLITDELKNRMALACIPFGFIIDNVSISTVTALPDESANLKFKPHVCRDDGPIQIKK